MKIKILKIITKINLFIGNLIDEKIKKTFKDIYKLKNKYKILWLTTLPLCIIFITLNITTTLIFFISYFIIFWLKFFKIRIFNRKTKNLIYKKRFKFLKNFYSIILEKILITYPKQKAFLLFYIIFKSVYEKDTSFLKKDYIPEFLRSISNRIIILLIISLPYICIYCNTQLIKIIKDLKEYNYESKKAFFNTILVNILKDLTNDYNILILKLKIKFFKNKIVFNSKKDIIKALYYKKEFGGNFNINKKYLKYVLAKQKINDKKYCKEHFTAISNLKNDKVVYLNETSKKELTYQKYHQDVKNYTNEIYKNMYNHKGSINCKKETYYTPNIISEKKNMIFINPEYNNKFLNSIKSENLNMIVAAHSLNLDQIYMENIFLNVNGINKNVLLENLNLKKTIEYYTENKDFIETENYESLLGVNFFWKENEKILKNLNFPDKLDLCYDLNIEFDSSPKEINFQLFKEVISKK